MVDLSKSKYYYVTGNTSQGFVNYLATNIRDIKHLIVLKHHSHTIKTAVLKQLIQKLAEMSVPLEILCSPFGEEYLEGIIARDRSLAVLSDTAMTQSIKHDKVIKLSQWFPELNAEIDHETERIHASREKSYEKLDK